MVASWGEHPIGREGRSRYDLMINMSNTSLKPLVLTATSVLVGLTSCTTVPAGSASVVAVVDQAPPPPPRQQYAQWAKPSRSAVWIPAHNEWTRERGYVWVGGYYTYPPHRNNRWVAPQYTHHNNGYNYQPGHWAN